MANLIESAAAWVAGVRQIETTDPVVGGPPNDGTGAGMVNIPHKQLADRTAFLKAAHDALAGVALTTTNSPRLLAQNGHFRLGTGGLMLQWGRATLDAAATALTFPVAFPNACFVVIPGDMATLASAGAAHRISVVGSTITANGFTAFANSNSDDTEFVSTPMSYFALGH